VTVRIAPHRGAATTHALVSAVVGDATLAAVSATDVTILLSGVDAGVDTGSGTDLLDSATTDSVLVVGADDPHLSPIADGFPGRVLRVGYASTHDVSVDSVDATLDGTTIVAVVAGERVTVALPLIGERHVLAALAALAAGIALGIAPATAASALGAVTDREPGNLELLPTRAGITILDDSYDASALSTTEALKTLAEITPVGRRSIAVLGALSGIEGDPREEHDRIGRIVVRLNIALLIAIGSGARHLQAAAGLEGSWDGESVLVATADEAYDLLRAEIRESDIVLVKTDPTVLHSNGGTHTLGQRLGRLYA